MIKNLRITHTLSLIKKEMKNYSKNFPFRKVILAVMLLF